MNYNPYRPPFQANTRGGIVSETGRNQHSLIVTAYCPFCAEETQQIVYYSYNTAIAHECGGCSRQVWNNTRYSHTTTRHTTALAVRRSVENQGSLGRNWTKLFVDNVAEGEQCLLCRAYPQTPSRKCDRPARQSHIA